MKNRLILFGVLIVVLVPIVWFFVIKPRLVERERQVRIAELIPKLESEISAGKWHEARDTGKELQRVGFVVSPEKVAAIDAGIQKQFVIDRETHRRADLVQGIAEVKALVADLKQSGDECAIARAWKKIRVCRAKDPEWGEVNQLVSRLEVVRKKRFKAAVDVQVKKEIEGRQGYAKLYEDRLLDAGISADVYVTGSARDSLTVKWPLVSKALVHKISEGTVLEEMRLIGFKEVTYTDGFNESYGFTLKAVTAEASVKDAWGKRAGCGAAAEPFVLTRE